MRGQYNLTPEEHDVLFPYIKEILEKLDKYQREIYSLTHLEIAPCHVDDLMGELGWERYEMDHNGWQCDCWMYYSHPDYEYTIVVYYEGFTFNLEMHRGDIDDE